MKTYFICTKELNTVMCILYESLYEFCDRFFLVFTILRIYQLILVCIKT